MCKRLSKIFLTIALLATTSSFACDENISCDKCAKESEHSWNPDNQYETARLKRFYSMDEQITAAYKSNDFNKVKELAKENLELASIYRCNWNYGNAIHDTNRVLGLISLRNGDIDTATEYLHKAGKSTGSPQLNTFGPELDLANELLHRGKVDAVKSYLKNIKSFWEMDDGQVDAWLAEIDKNGKPELDRFASKRPGLLLSIVFWLATLWPVVVSGAFLYMRRVRITRKLRFFIFAVLSGYGITFAGSWIANYGCLVILESMEDLGAVPLFFVSFLPLGIAFLLPVLTVFFLMRYLHPNVDQPQVPESNGSQR